MVESLIKLLKEKYDYDEKIITALAKIVPEMVRYYGDDYAELIKEAITKTEIISCNEMQTISLVIENKDLIREDNSISILKEDKAIASGKYISEPTVVFDQVLNAYVISKVNRYIILSHTYNLDSPKGVAALTRELIELIKSFKDEYRIENSLIIRKSGLKEEKKQILNDNGKLILKLVEEKNAGLEEGFNINDEEKIVSLILKDKYISTDHGLSSEIALAIDEILGLKNDRVLSDINKNAAFSVEAGNDVFNQLSYYQDTATVLEYNKKPVNSSDDIAKKSREELEQLKNEVATYFAHHYISNKDNYYENVA